MQSVARHHTAPQTGVGFDLLRGQVLRVIDLRVEMDLNVGVTACFAQTSNHYSFKPIDVEVLDP
jgi:uncharacterized protein YcgI (DUF1989 family)